MLTPEEIYKEIDSHPPLMQDTAKEKYIGQTVDWPLLFIDGSVNERGEARLTFRYDRQTSYPLAGIRGVVALSEHPWLKTLPAETPVRVKAQIRELDALVIKLDILELSLPQAVAA
jgi:hypothetical protein